ncbi:MAG: substrate-binding domain-containing protein [Anaerolineae bacterium]|nr:substrate-binding domain-containing protein [Anaerolineae bacterium]
MTTFERRQRILTLLREQSNATVIELAKLLNVSEGTIRNDLTALDEAQQIMRVRGGAVVRDIHPVQMPALAAKARVNAPAKQRIARWAADMVEDGDAILLDASTTVFHMAAYLQDRRNLTIITNGLEVARALAANRANTTILIGGVLRADGTSVTGHLGEKMLRDLHIKTAFVSCSGFTVEVGLTELDLQEAQLKSHMIRSASRVIALIDSSKFGRAALVPFAAVEQISHILTDSQVDPATLECLRQTNITITVCGETTASSFTPLDTQRTHYRVGFANLSEEIPFAVDVRRGLERAAKEAGNIDLIVADNQLQGEVALRIAEHLIGKGVDLVIEYQIDEKVGSLIMNKFQQAGIPVIAVDIPMLGASFFGADNYQSGHTAGAALGNWIKKQWAGAVDHLIVLEEPRAGALPAARIHGQIDGLQSVIGEIPAEKICYLDSGNTTELSEMQMARALEEYASAHHLAVISFNDDAAFGALSAARKAGREADVVIIGQGADRKLRPEIRRPNSRIIGSTAFMPEKYGEKLIDLALKILQGKPVPPAVYTDHTFINAKNIDLFYPE